MINLKGKDNVADAVNDVLQQEALKGNQHKIDKNKNNKIDAQDFKILRGEKKKPDVKEEIDVKDRTVDMIAGRIKTDKKDDVGPSGDFKSTKVRFHAGPDNSDDTVETTATDANKEMQNKTKLRMGEETEQLDEKNWIAGAIKNPGAMTAAAKREGKSTSEYIKSHEKEGGKAGQRARLAKTLKGFKEQYEENSIYDQMIQEVLSKDASAGDWIHDFVHSDNPKFAGKSKEMRKKMALAAYYAKQRNEEVEQIDEKVLSTELQTVNGNHVVNSQTHQHPNAKHGVQTDTLVHKGTIEPNSYGAKKKKFEVHNHPNRGLIFQTKHTDDEKQAIKKHLVKNDYASKGTDIYKEEIEYIEEDYDKEHKGTKEHKAWHHGADAARDEHIGSLDEAAKWRSTPVAKKVTDPDDYQDSVSYDYHHDNPKSTGMKKATSDTPEKYGSLSARPKAQVVSQGARKGMITKQHGERLKFRIKSGMNNEEVELDEGLGDKLKAVGKKALEKLGHGSDEDMRKDLQKKMGVPQTGQKPVQKEETELEEGWDDMMKAVKERRGPQPSGGSGVKSGSRYGGSKQKDKPEQGEDKKKVTEAKHPEDDSVPFAPPYKTTSDPVVTDKSGAKHTPMSRVKNLARQAMKKLNKDMKNK